MTQFRCRILRVKENRYRWQIMDNLNSTLSYGSIQGPRRLAASVGRARLERYKANPPPPLGYSPTHKTITARQTKQC
jgi:hypothetical protein